MAHIGSPQVVEVISMICTSVEFFPQKLCQGHSKGTRIKIRMGERERLEFSQKVVSVVYSFVHLL